MFDIRRLSVFALSAGLLGLVACGDVTTTDEELETSALECRQSTATWEVGDGILECGRRGAYTDVEADFDCDTNSVTVESCKNLSNVVLDFGDGNHQKFDNLSGYTGTFAGTGDNEGLPILGVWIKSGTYRSGDGPGYGYRIDAPTCETDDGPGTPDGDPGNVSGTGGDGTIPGGGLDPFGGTGGGIPLLP